jgi:hypothetical protein
MTTLALASSARNLLSRPGTLKNPNRSSRQLMTRNRAVAATSPFPQFHAGSDLRKMDACAPWLCAPPKVLLSGQDQLRLPQQPLLLLPTDEWDGKIKVAVVTVLFFPLLAVFYRINQIGEGKDWSSLQRALHICTTQAAKLQHEVKWLASKMVRRNS